MVLFTICLLVVSAQATKCLPQASEIEVETGPYFGGKIIVDDSNCGIKGNPDDPVEKYTMRIDHKLCGSLVKPESNTVETFITVQENLDIFTHSTRRCTNCYAPYSKTLNFCFIPQICCRL